MEWVALIVVALAVFDVPEKLIERIGRRWRVEHPEKALADARWRLAVADAAVEVLAAELVEQEFEAEAFARAACLDLRELTRRRDDLASAHRDARKTAAGLLRRAEAAERRAAQAEAALDAHAHTSALWLAKVGYEVYGPNAGTRPGACG
jgi:peptidoglycan hydrolase CwlO-like protein